MLLLLVLSPLPLLAFVNVRRAVAGHGFEPIIDNVVSYLLLFLIFAAGALTTGLYHALGPRRRNVVAYAFAGASGSTALMTAADLIDSYFSGPGVGWIWPLAGFALGFAFGQRVTALHFDRSKPRQRLHRGENPLRADSRHFYNLCVQCRMILRSADGCYGPECEPRPKSAKNGRCLIAEAVLHFHAL
jgi:hypothetical protein